MATEHTLDFLIVFWTIERLIPSPATVPKVQLRMCLVMS